MARINDIFRNNYKEIQNGSYVWKDEEIEIIYEFVNKFIKKHNVIIKGYQREDLQQELVMEFFNAIQKYNIDNIHPLTTYLIASFRRKCYHLRNDRISVDAVSIEDLDDIEDPRELDDQISKMKKEIIERFKELNKDNIIALEYYFSERGKITCDMLAEEYGLTRARIHQYLVKAIKRAREDEEIKKLAIH